MQVKETVFQPKLSACYRERGGHSRRISQIPVTSIGIKESEKFSNNNYRQGKVHNRTLCLIYAPPLSE